MNSIMSAGVAIFCFGLVGAIVSFAVLLSGPGKKRALHRLLITVGLGLAGFLAGAWFGIQYFCSPGDAGNLCGLGGVFGTGPLAAGLGLVAGSVLMLKAHCDTP